MPESARVEASRKEFRRDVWIGAATATGAAFYLILIPSQTLPEHDGFASISSRTLPYLIGLTVLLLGVVLCGVSLRRSRRATPGGWPLVGRQAALRVLVYTGAIVLYTVGIGYLGYVTSSVAMLLFAMWFSGARKRYIIVVASIATSLILYGFFHLLMQIPLPETPLY